MSELYEESFKITDSSSLTWAFRKLHEYKLKESDINKVADEEINRIMGWQEEALKPIQNNISYFEGLIRTYHENKLEEDPQQNKTLSTPYGKCKSRRTKETIDKSDEQILLDYIVKNNLHEYIKPSIKWADFKKSLHIVGETVVDDNGEIIPGVKIKPETVNFSFEVES